MPLFRTKLTFDAAADKLTQAVIGFERFDVECAQEHPEVVSQVQLRRELMAVRLFAVLVSLKSCGRRDWSERGGELFDILFERVLAALPDGTSLPVIHRDWLAEQMAYYGLAATIGEGPTSIDGFGREVGECFRLVLLESPSDSLNRLGRGVFFRGLAQVSQVTTEYKLAER